MCPKCHRHKPSGLCSSAGEQRPIKLELQEHCPVELTGSQARGVGSAINIVAIDLNVGVDLDRPLMELMKVVEGER